MYKREQLENIMTCSWILKKGGLQVAVNAAVAFRVVSLDITDFAGP